MSDGPSEPVSKTPTLKRSLTLSFAQRYTNILLTLPTIVIVSRVLTPAEIGVYSVAAAFVALIHMLRDFGVSDYIIQAPELNASAARTAFTINALIAWSLAILLFVASTFIADFYDEPTLKHLLQILSANFVLLPFGSIVTATLRRSMRFDLLYKINLAQQGTQSGATVLLVLAGVGPAGLAWGSLLGMVAIVLASVYWGRSYRVRGISFTYWREVAGFGMQRTVSDVVSRVGISAPDFIIGKIIGFAGAGLYSRGNGLINMFRQNVLGAVTSVTYAAYSEQNRASGNVHHLFLRAVETVTGFTWPAMGFAALLAFCVMRIMFGDQWDGAVPILQLLAIALIIDGIIPECVHFLLAIGRVRTVTALTIGIQVLRILSLVPAAYISLWAVAAAQIPISLLGISLYYLFVIRHSAVTLPALLTALRNSAVVTLGALAWPVVVVLAWPPAGDNVWLPVLLATPGFVAGWLVTLYATKHPLWRDISGVLSSVQRKLRPGSKARA